MARIWQQLSLQEAKQNPLYGVKNWLAVFAFGVIALPLREFGALVNAANSASVQVSVMLKIADAMAIGTYLKSVLAFETLMAVVIFWLLFIKHRSFRPVASSFLLAFWPVSAAFAYATEPPFFDYGGALAKEFFGWILSCAVWVTYLQRSRRVRVTFENQVLEGESVAVLGLVNPSKTTITGSTQTLFPMPVAAASSASTPSSPESRQEAPTLAKQSALSHVDTAEGFWAAALQELETPERKSGLWAKAFALANGNESEAKAAYLRERVLQIEQESKEAKEHDEQQLAEVAERERHAARAKLGEKRAELLDCVQFIKLNADKTPVQPLTKLVRLLGGRVDWGSVGLLSSGWVVALKGESLTLRDDDELRKWVLETVMPMADSALPNQADTSPHGDCPSCEAVISMSAASCYGCQAVFGYGSTWSPTLRSDL